jgi:CHASE2 domain-containing sensor protein
MTRAPGSGIVAFLVNLGKRAWFWTARARRSDVIRHCLHALPVILIISGLTFFMEHAGWFDRYENAELDSLNLLQSPLDPSHLVLVGITDDDYRQFFSERSPLDAEMVTKVIGAIAKGGARVIGVDLDTSAPVFENLQVSREWPALVWAQDAVVVGGDRLVPSAALGGHAVRAIDASAVALLPQDSDGVIRRFAPRFTTNQGSVSSFPFAVALAACRSGITAFCAQAGSSETAADQTLRLNFCGERYAFTPLSIANLLKVSTTEGWPNGPLKDKVVLLGGYYRAGRDFYVTPVGQMAGLQLMAQAVESELGGGIRPATEALAVVLDVLAGLFIVVVNNRLRPAIALVVSLTAIPVLALIGSFMTFATLAWWVSFVPVTVGALIHELHHHALEYHRLLQERETAHATGPGAPLGS